MVFLSSPLCEGSMHNIFENCKNLFEEFDLCNALVRLSGRHKLYILKCYLSDYERTLSG